MVLLASVTSLPELVAGASAVALARAPDVAVGNVLGACALNFAMIAVVDALHRSASIYSLASQGHALGAGFAALMLGLVGFALLFPSATGIRLGHVSLTTPLLFLLYAVAMRTIYQYERQVPARPEPARSDENESPGALAWRYVAVASVVVAAAVFLPFSAARVAREMGWTEGFVGTLLVALVTTLPELAVTIAAVRLRALDLAIGNLIGSNLFNLVVLGVDDLLYTPTSLYAAVAPTHAVSVVTGTMMSAAVIVALVARQQARLLNFVSWTSVVLALLFFANAWIHFRQSP
jgi:cation:H+ antiporter